jgi:putative membrane protein
MENITIEQKYNKWIIILSVAIPLVVALLFGVKLKDFGYNVTPLSFLPPIYATINGITALLLMSAVWAIKNGNRQLHENLMKTAIGCSVAFLGMYVAYHMTADATVFGDVNQNGTLDLDEKTKVGLLRFFYYFILLTHILLSVVIIPMVLITYVRALAGNFERHKKISRITYPLWLYVAVTGVVVYLMISPYYAR